jgi:hypothetical protein
MLTEIFSLIHGWCYTVVLFTNSTHVTKQVTVLAVLGA